MMFFAKKYRVFVWIILVILILGVLNIYQKETKGFFSSLSLPIQGLFWQTGERTSNFFSSIFSAGSLQEEVNSLELKNQRLLSKLTNLSSLEEENKVLRKAFNSKIREEFNLSLVLIIAKDISGDFITIDKGYLDGMTKNLAIITEGKILVGKIDEVYSKSARVILASNKDLSFDAKISLEEPVFGLVKGLSKSKSLIDLIPKEKEIKKGDQVLTSSISGIFPEGLLIGFIEEVRKTDLDSFQQAVISHYFDLSLSENLFVILNYEN